MKRKFKKKEQRKERKYGRKIKKKEERNKRGKSKNTIKEKEGMMERKKEERKIFHCFYAKFRSRGPSVSRTFGLPDLRSTGPTPL